MAPCRGFETNSLRKGTWASVGWTSAFHCNVGIFVLDALGSPSLSRVRCNIRYPRRTAIIAHPQAGRQPAMSRRITAVLGGREQTRNAAGCST